MTKSFTSLTFSMILLASYGCSSEPSPPANLPATANQSTHPNETPTSSPPEANQESFEEPSSTGRRGPVTLGGTPAPETPTSDNSDTPTELSAKAATDSVFEAIKPLQILMGAWEGKTQKPFGAFSAVDEPEWVWDFLSKKDQPALVMESDASPYFQKLRLTFDPQEKNYLLTSEHKSYDQRQFVGQFIQEIQDVPGDDKKLHRTYKLQFTQVSPVDESEQWQIVINQRDNNRYLMEMSKKRGKANFLRFDTVASQRQGTSFALSDSDYGEKTCIVSAGLGTMTVSFEGKTYYVCCSGCSAAFNDEPERWIAKALEEQKSE